MDAIARYLKVCWGSGNTGSETCDDDDGPRQAGEKETASSIAESENEILPVVELSKVYGAFLAEAKNAWKSDVDSAIWRGRSKCSTQPSFTAEEVNVLTSNDGDCDGMERPATLGQQIIRHSVSLVEIHDFFLKLHPRRFLPSSNSSMTTSCTGTIKTVNEDKGNERTRTKARAHKPSAPSIQVEIFLSDPEKFIYKRALHCVNFPVLSSPLSEPSVTPSSQGTRCSSSGSEADTVLSPTDKLSIEPDMLMTCLRDAFGISKRIHDRYFNEVKNSIPNKDPSKLLLRELQDRLYQLETNQHKYYRMGSFLSMDGYSKWRSKQLSYVKRLIRRFWKNDLPGYLGMQVSGVNTHEEYKILQEKLFKYEMKMKMASFKNGLEQETISVFPVSSAAKKILKEFGLRYGVCSLFRQISALMCMAKNFEYNGWYIKCCTQSVFEISNLLRAQCQIMVKDELQMLIEAINYLQERIEYTMKNIKLLCPNKLAFETISWMLEILKAMVKIKRDLGIWEETQQSEEELIRCLVRTAIEVGYNNFKNNIGIDVELETPQMLRCLLADIRVELKFYKDLATICPDLSKYVSVESEATTKLYSLLMKDVREVCIQRIQPGSEDSSIDVEMLRLAFLLSKLDEDWAYYISPRAQKWRIYFMKEVTNTMEATSLSIVKLIRRFIGKDFWDILEFECNGEGDVNGDRTRSPCIQSIKSVSASTTPLVPSEKSAFQRVNKKGISSDNINNYEERSKIDDGRYEIKGSKIKDGNRTVCEPLAQEELHSSSLKMISENTYIVEALVSTQALDYDNGFEQDVISRENPTDEENSSSSLAYETPPSSGIDHDVRSKESGRSSVQSTESFHSLSNASSQTIQSPDSSVFREFSANTSSENKNNSLAVTNGILNEIIDNVFMIEEREIEAFVQDVLDKAILSISRDEAGTVQNRELLFSSALGAPSLVNKSEGSHFNNIVIPKPRKISKSNESVYFSESERKSDLVSPAFKVVEADNYINGIFAKSNNKISTHSKKSFSSPSNIIDDSKMQNKNIGKAQLQNSIEETEKVGNRSDDKFTSRLAEDLDPSNDTEASKSTRASSSTSTVEHFSFNTPKRGKVLISSSLLDILLVIERITSFFKKLHKLLVPTFCHPRFTAELYDLQNEHDIFSGHLFKGLTMGIKEALMTFADGILALDVCGWDEEELLTELNSEVIERLREKQRNGLISGCSHDPNRRISWNAYNQGEGSYYCPQVSRIIRYCIGSWESISVQVCTRLNDVRSLIDDVMNVIEGRAKRACGIAQQNANESEAISENLRKTLRIGYLDWRNCQESLELIWKSQVCIVAQRITVMLGKIIEVLLSLSLKWTEKAPYNQQLKPVSIFLEYQMDNLRKNLYPVSLKAVVKEIWQRLIAMLHSYADILRLNRANPLQDAERYIQLMSICLKHLVVDDDTGDKLTALCRPLLLRFQLYSYCPEQLKLIWDIFFNLESENPTFLRNLDFKEILLNMRSTGLVQRAFTGVEFVEILLANKAWMQQFGIDDSRTDVENAVAIGEMLFERQMIICVERPRSSDETGVRHIDLSTSAKSEQVTIIHVGSREFILSPNLDDQVEDVTDESVEDTFQNSNDHVYKINVKYCNASDLSIKVRRVLRQAGTRFSRVIQHDITNILEYGSYWKKERAFIDILKIVAPRSFRPKAFSWPYA